MQAESWANWPERIRPYIQKTGRLVVCRRLHVAEPTLRSWLNGWRQINLTDFFSLCESVGADPALILFGSHVLGAEYQAALAKLTTLVVEPPQANYKPTSRRR